MRQHQPRWRLLILFLMVIATVAAVSIYKAAGVIDWHGVWGAVTKVTLISTITYGGWEIFRRWGWRWKLFKGWLVDVPDISGRWSGVARSNFIAADGEGDDAKEIPVTAEIVQTFTSINIRFNPETGKSNSYSVTASFIHDPEAQRCRLIYTYANEPKVTEAHLDRHFGTAILEIEGTPPTKMHGLYMTDRKNQTKGDLELSRAS